MNLLKRLAVLVGIIACIGVMTGCEDSSDNDSTTFKNSSSATITVNPESNETFKSFVLKPGESKEVDRIGGQIDYSYTSTKKVTVVNIEEHEVLFSDAINL